jgi:uncharacterized protein (DUF1800 family)
MEMIRNMHATTDTLLAPYDPSTSLAWTERQAAHLLNRAQFGCTPAEIDRAVNDGLPATLQRLLEPQSESDEFSKAEATLRQTAISTANISDLKIWWLYRIRYSANPLAEKMSVFWHNHFATSNAKVNSVAHMLGQNQLIRAHSLGDFKTLLHGMSRDTAMLIWLDGNANRKRHPNENFAREIMELFALGVGNYTEKDIQEAARAFTGWHVRDGHFWKNQLQHDESAKTVFGQTGLFDGNDIVDLCLTQPACPRFLATKLAKIFVCPEPSAGQIEQFASRIRHHDMNLKPILRELYSSQWFFEQVNRRALIKSPLDLALGTLRAIADPISWPAVVQLLADLGQNVFEPPSVKGWEGGRLWITSQSLLQRANFATELTTSDKYGPLCGAVRQVASEAPERIVRKLERWLLTDSLDEMACQELVSFHRRAEGNVEQKLRGLIQLILTLPEFQLC